MKWQGHIYETPISRLAMRNLSTWYSFWRGTCRNNFCTAVKWLVKIFDKTKDAYRLTRINIFCLSFSQQLLKLNLVVWVSLTAWIWRLCRLSSVRTCKIIRKGKKVSDLTPSLRTPFAHWILPFTYPDLHTCKMRIKWFCHQILLPASRLQVYTGTRETTADRLERGVTAPWVEITGACHSDAHR